MTDLIKNLAVRDLAPQRTVSLFKDQEDTIEQLNEEYGINIKLSKLVREGVDIALKEISKQLKETE